MDSIERGAWERGQEQLLNEIWYMLSLLENSCPDTGHGKAQKRMLKLVVQMISTGECDRILGGTDER